MFNTKKEILKTIDNGFYKLMKVINNYGKITYSIYKKKFYDNGNTNDICLSNGIIEFKNANDYFDYLCKTKQSITFYEFKKNKIDEEEDYFEGIDDKLNDNEIFEFNFETKGNNINLYFDGKKIEQSFTKNSKEKEEIIVKQLFLNEIKNNLICKKVNEYFDGPFIISIMNQEFTLVDSNGIGILGKGKMGFIKNFEGNPFGGGALDGDYWFQRSIIGNEKEEHTLITYLFYKNKIIAKFIESYGLIDGDLFVLNKERIIEEGYYNVNNREEVKGKDVKNIYKEENPQGGFFGINDDSFFHMHIRLMQDFIEKE